jgi:hypothetical protein
LKDESAGQSTVIAFVCAALLALYCFVCYKTSQGPFPQQTIFANPYDNWRSEPVGDGVLVENDGDRVKITLDNGRPLSPTNHVLNMDQRIFKRQGMRVHVEKVTIQKTNEYYSLELPKI